MGLARYVLNWLVRRPMLRLGLLRLDLSEQDREWFARSRLRQFGTFPWVIGDTVRSLFAAWLLLPVPRPLHDAALVALAAMWVVTVAMRRTLQRPIAQPERLLAHIAVLLVARALVWSVIVSLVVRHAGSNVGIAVLFALTAILLDVLRTMALPVAGLVSGSLIIVGLASAFLRTPGVDKSAVLAISAVALAALHYALFTMHYLFATRRLRTRRLLLANETIQSLLTQYDEHGADALVEVDCDGRLMRPSPRLCEMLGRTEAELRGVGIATLFEPGRERSAMLGAARRHNRFRNHVIPLRIRGERRWWSVSGGGVFDAGGLQQGFRCFVQDVTEQRATEEQVRIMATRDNLTGLVNRGVFTTHLDEALAACAQGQQCAVLFIDLDSFKLVNDTYGHGAGDAVLVAAARRIEASLGKDMVAARLGGDEFAVLACDIDAEETVTRLGATLIDALSQPVERDGLELPCGASAGIAIGPEHGRKSEELLRAADIALYEAKARGRGRSMLFHPRLLREVQEHRAMEADLRAALERGQFEIRYQPLIDIATLRTAGYEALLRWNHPTRGRIAPSQFIPLAEEIGLIGALGEWVLRQALAEAATWREDLTIAVNVSPAQMRGEALLGQVADVLAQTGLAPHRLELEITETLLMDHGEVHMRTLHRLRELGVRIALDDFGTGYSSLNYLRRFPFDKLKIDRSFISEIAEEPESRAIVETVLSLAREFRMKTTAEGIESQAQFDRLRMLGCSQAQGFLFDKPLLPAEMPEEHRRRAKPAASRPIDWLAMEA